ncbi:MAG: hypothetical protein HQM08_27145 [Candidatus Riflebacteria bacterium]|nr:hypothetical protein [Candidatus Riflebacteria bacterium]
MIKKFAVFGNVNSFSKTSVFLILIVLSIVCTSLAVLGNEPPVLSSSDSAQITDSSPALANGLYLVLRQADEQKMLKPESKSEIVLINDGRFLEPAERNPTNFIVVRTDKFVPIILTGEPKKGTDDKGKLSIGLQLAPEQVTPLENLTGKNLGKSMAIVIGGQVVTVHKIKSAIVGGQIQITRCANTGCKVLFSVLQQKKSK